MSNEYAIHHVTSNLNDWYMDNKGRYPQETLDNILNEDDIGDIIDLIHSLKSEVDNLRMYAEDMYQLATKANFNESDWRDFEQVYNEMMKY